MYETVDTATWHEIPIIGEIIYISLIDKVFAIRTPKKKAFWRTDAGMRPTINSRYRKPSRAADLFHAIYEIRSCVLAVDDHCFLNRI